MQSIEEYLTRYSFRLLFIAGGITVIAQTICLSLTPAKAILSNVLIGLMGVLATSGCAAAAFLSRSTRNLWLLLGGGFLLTSVGQLCSTYYEFATNTNSQSTAINPDFLYFAYGIPFLLAICSASNDEGLKTLLWFDIAQAAIATTLAYVQIFSALPAFGTKVPISSRQLMYLYNAENLILAGAVSLRLISNPVRSKKRFYGALAFYLWVYALVALIVGYLELEREIPDGLQDVAWSIPYLIVLGTLYFRKDPQGKDEDAENKRTPLSLLIDNLSPILFTLAIVLMSVTVAVVHKALAFLCIGTAVLLYGIRAALLHAKYAQSREELAHSAIELQRANEKLLNQSIRDGLTGIYNRRYFDEVLLQAWVRSQRAKEPLSLLMIDVDHFKVLNDRYGHQLGDECLRLIAADIDSHVRRPDDLAARYGGEEFAVILPGTNREGAFAIAEDVRASVSKLVLFECTKDFHQRLTISIGISTETHFVGADPVDFIKRADRALYKAKSQGRDQVQFQDLVGGCSGEPQSFVSNLPKGIESPQ